MPALIEMLLCVSSSLALPLAVLVYVHLSRATRYRNASLSEHVLLLPPTSTIWLTGGVPEGFLDLLLYLRSFCFFLLGARHRGTCEPCLEEPLFLRFEVGSSTADRRERWGAERVRRIRKRRFASVRISVCGIERFARSLSLFLMLSVHPCFCHASSAYIGTRSSALLSLLAAAGSAEPHGRRASLAGRTPPLLYERSAHAHASLDVLDSCRPFFPVRVWRSRCGREGPSYCIIKA